MNQRVRSAWEAEAVILLRAELQNQVNPAADRIRAARALLEHLDRRPEPGIYANLFDLFEALTEAELSCLALAAEE